MSGCAAASSGGAGSPAEAVEEALASARLEGVELSREFLADLRRAASGDFDADELVERTLVRHRR